jgi:hypothetical protein
VIGNTKEPVIAFFVTNNSIREFDEGVGLEKGSNHHAVAIEESKGDPFYVLCIDEGESVNIFSHISSSNYSPKNDGGFHAKFKTGPEIPEEIKDKDLFGMGYPYYCCLYGSKICITTDYGVCLLSIKDLNLI